MREFYANLSEKIQAELPNIDIERCDISIKELIEMINDRE